MENNGSNGNMGVNGGDLNNGPGLSGSAAPIDVMYFHGYTIDGARFTIAGVIENEEVKLGIALCASGDQFKKERGRAIASGRVLNQRRSPKGLYIKSVYALPSDNQFAVENGAFPIDYYKGNEVKIFREMGCEFGWHARKDLMNEFNLSNRPK